MSLIPLGPRELLIKIVHRLNYALVDGEELDEYLDDDLSAIEIVDQLLNAHKDEVLREAAERIRAAAPPTIITPGGPYTRGQMFAADLIDPDKEDQ